MLTFFPSLYEPCGRRVAIAWPRLFQRFSTARRLTAKDAAPRWSPATFQADRRSRASVEDVGAVVLDLDGGPPLRDLRATLRGVYCFVHSTWGFLPEAERWRVVIPLDRRVILDEYERCWRWAASLLERSGVRPDYAARDASRVWAVPSMPVGSTYSYVTIEGPVASTARALRTIPRTRALTSARSVEARTGADVLERARRYVARCDPAVAGAGGHRATFRVALALVRGFDLSSTDALQILIEDFNPRCQPAWSVRELAHKVKSAAERARLEPGWLLRSNGRSTQYAQGKGNFR